MTRADGAGTGDGNDEGRPTGALRRTRAARPGALRIPTRRELRDVAQLAGPIVLVQVGIQLMGVVDAAMVGRVSPAAMAATALGNFYWMLVTIVGQGTIMALDPLVSQAVGARDWLGVRLGLQRGLVLGVVLAVPAMLLLVPAGAALVALGQPADVAHLAGGYALACIPGALAYFWFVALRQTLQAFASVRPILVTIVLANLCNVVLDWALIFGRLGAPELGVAGAAWATTASRWIMCVSLYVAGWSTFRPHMRGSWRRALQWVPIGRMLRLGLPIGFHQWLEIAAFGGALLLMGLFGTVALAAHQIAITLASLTYMVPLGTSAAAAVLVGHAIGRGDEEAARREGSAALVCGVGFMACTAIVLFAFPHALVRIFTDERQVVVLAVALVPVAAVFQVFDGVQGVSSGVLRGAGDTTVPMLINMLGFVGVGIPAAAWLAFGLGLGPTGVWWGLVAALVVVSAALGWRVHTHLGGDLRRIAVDHGVGESPT